MRTFTQSQIEAIAAALGDTTNGLTGLEIGHLLTTCGIRDTDPSLAKRHRIYNAFVGSQNARGDRASILAFIRKSMKPERYIGKIERFESMRTNLNKALAFTGLAIDQAGKIDAVDAVTTLPEAERRANELRADLSARGVHPDVLLHCRAELVADNYFHAVLEATKSVAEKLRARTGLLDDGSTLVDRALTGNPPMLAITPLLDKNQISEQTGFVYLLKGMFGMFRNPTAHAPRINWEMTKTDAEDLLSLVSLIHRRIDAAVMPRRV